MNSPKLRSPASNLISAEHAARSFLAVGLILLSVAANGFAAYSESSESDSLTTVRPDLRNRLWPFDPELSEQPQRVMDAQELAHLSGIGAIACRAEGKRSVATAFLVGRFDIALTVASVFKRERRRVRPNECRYLTAGPSGAIYDRVPLIDIKSRWQQEAPVAGRVPHDVAVVQLEREVSFARSTVTVRPLRNIAARVRLVGFPQELLGNTLKSEADGMLLSRTDDSCARLTHDAATASFARGAPIFDTRDGAVVGLHTRSFRSTDGCSRPMNVVVPVDQWVVQTLREQIAVASDVDRTPAAVAAAAGSRR